MTVALNELALLRNALCWIIEECLVRDAFALSALVCEILHLCNRSVEPLEAKDPTNDYPTLVASTRLAAAAARVGTRERFCRHLAEHIRLKSVIQI
jgi:hypothetical protein